MRGLADFNYKFCSPNYAMKHKTSQSFLLHKHSVISCDIAKGGALRERRNVRGSCRKPLFRGAILHIMYQVLVMLKRLPQTTLRRTVFEFKKREAWD